MKRDRLFIIFAISLILGGCYFKKTDKLRVIPVEPGYKVDQIDFVRGRLIYFTSPITDSTYIPKDTIVEDKMMGGYYKLVESYGERED